MDFAKSGRKIKISMDERWVRKILKVKFLPQYGAILYLGIFGQKLMNLMKKAVPVLL